MNRNKIECRIITVKDGYKQEENRYSKLIDQLRLNPASDYFSIDFIDGITPTSGYANSFKIMDGIYENRLYNWISHYSLWKTKSEMLILEDDVLIEGICWEKIYSIINEFKEANINSILYLQSSDPIGKDKYYSDMIEITPNLASITPYQHEGHHYAGTAAYFITAKMAEYLSEKISLVMPTDSYFHHKVMNGEIENHVTPIEYLNYFKINSNLWGEVY